MANLLTKHDPFHLHAILGLLALTHFTYRWFLILSTGSAFRETESIQQKVWTVSIHFWLPLISLALPVPPKRNLARPMIWPEFRLHSLLFATRHVVACVASIFYMEYYENAKQRPNTITRLCVMLFFTLWNQVIMASASLVTKHYGSSSERTTNAMPYPANMLPNQVTCTRSMYRNSQFLAAGMAHCMDNPTLAFMPLLAIQIAPFCMTLVRKNLMGASGHHCIYAWALWLNLPGMVAVMVYWQEQQHQDAWRSVMWAFLVYWFTTHLRLTRHWNKHVTWFAGPLVAHAVMAACHHVVPVLKEWLPSLQCPRVIWLVAKASRASLDIAWENQHVLLPNMFRGRKLNRSYERCNMLVSWTSWSLGVVCDFAFIVGVVLSVTMVVLRALSTTEDLSSIG